MIACRLRGAAPSVPRVNSIGGGYPLLLPQYGVAGAAAAAGLKKPGLTIPHAVSTAFPPLTALPIPSGMPLLPPPPPLVAGGAAPPPLSAAGSDPTANGGSAADYEEYKKQFQKRMSRGGEDDDSDEDGPNPPPPLLGAAGGGGGGTVSGAGGGGGGGAPTAAVAAGLLDPSGLSHSLQYINSVKFQVAKCVQQMMVNPNNPKHSEFAALYNYYQSTKIKKKIDTVLTAKDVTVCDWNGMEWSGVEWSWI